MAGDSQIHNSSSAPRRLAPKCHLTFSISTVHATLTGRRFQSHRSRRCHYVAACACHLSSCLPRALPLSLLGSRSTAEFVVFIAVPYFSSTSAAYSKLSVSAKPCSSASRSPHHPCQEYIVRLVHEELAFSSS